VRCAKTGIVILVPGIVTSHWIRTSHERPLSVHRDAAPNGRAVMAEAMTNE
jgi:hypothetical protein